MQKLFEKLEARQIPIDTSGMMWDIMKANFIYAEQKAIEEQYWEGYKEGQYSGDQTAAESFNKKYTQDE